MHGGFGGGGGGGGGYGHSGGGGGYGHSGGGHHSGHSGHDGGHHHGGESHDQPTSAHNLGGQSQSIIGHMTSMVQNGQGVLGHIAAWLVGQHTGVQHHAGAQGSQSQHLGDASWASAAIQVEKKGLSWQKVTKIPGFQLVLFFLVIAGWLFFLGYLRHGDPNGAHSPLPTQQEWRQQLVGSNRVQEAGTEAGQSAPTPTAENAGFASSSNVSPSMFGSPRQVDGAAPLSVAPQSGGQTAAMFPLPAATSSNAMTSPYGMVAASPPAYGSPMTARPRARASFSSSAPEASEGAQMTSSPDSRRSFRHRVVTER